MNVKIAILASVFLLLFSNHASLAQQNSMGPCSPNQSGVNIGGDQIINCVLSDRVDADGSLIINADDLLWQRLEVASPDRQRAARLQETYRAHVQNIQRRSRRALDQCARCARVGSNFLEDADVLTAGMHMRFDLASCRQSLLIYLERMPCESDRDAFFELKSNFPGTSGINKIAAARFAATVLLEQNKKYKIKLGQTGACARGISLAPLSCLDLRERELSWPTN